LWANLEFDSLDSAEVAAASAVAHPRFTIHTAQSRSTQFLTSAF